MSDVGAHIFAKWRIVPKYVVPWSVSPSGVRWRFVVQGIIVSVFVECFLVWRGGLVEGCFVG